MTFAINWAGFAASKIEAQNINISPIADPAEDTFQLLFQSSELNPSASQNPPIYSPTAIDKQSNRERFLVFHMNFRTVSPAGKTSLTTYKQYTGFKKGTIWPLGPCFYWRAERTSLFWISHDWIRALSSTCIVILLAVYITRSKSQPRDRHGCQGTAGARLPRSVWTRGHSRCQHTSPATNELV